MNFCFHISRRLVAYGEGEVSSNERVRIEAHLDGCARCRERLRQIRQRTDLMRRLPLLDPAEELWGAIARDVSASRRPEPIKEAFVREAFSGRRGFGYRWLLRPAAITAAIFVIATGLLLTHRSGLLPGGHKGELNLAGYLDLVGMVAAAEPILREFPAAPGFIEVSWPEARATIGFPAIAPEILPGGYKLTAARLYNLGSLRALQFKYRSEQDALCVFQLPSGSKLSFGERPSEQYQADGVHCWRARSRDCVLYRFVLGETQCALMTRQTDPAVVDALIQAFKAEAGSSQASSATPSISVEAQTEQQPAQGAANAPELSPQEKKVIEYLQSVWGKDHSVTSVDQAMGIVGLRPSDETRFRTGQHIKQHPELHVIIRRWGWETLVLTPDEKLIARAIINATREQKPAPTLAEIAKAVGVSQNDVKRGLAMLERRQILKRDEAAAAAGYAVAAPRYLNWHPRLDFVFHRMTVSSRRNTSVN
ncbi:MAG: zf-HC2 domain-containing protein [Blastocatellia bacterium]